MGHIGVSRFQSGLFSSSMVIQSASSGFKFVFALMGLAQMLFYLGSASLGMTSPDSGISSDGLAARASQS